MLLSMKQNFGQKWMSLVMVYHKQILRGISMFCNSFALDCNLAVIWKIMYYTSYFLCLYIE